MTIDVANWLQQLGLEQYGAAFRDNDVDADVLPDLTAEDLIGMGVTSIGHRRKLLSAIASLGAEAPAALPPAVVAPASASAPALAPVPPPAPAEAERRQLTVMFCDLVGSTALSTAMDPEDLRDVITSFQTRCAEAVRRYDGFVAKYMGDGILVYFGYPRAHEDEPERAARAGLDIVAAMADLNAAVPRPPGVELTVRIGIATGPVIVGDQIGEGTASETAVIGETPNLAARLQALAEPNQIVVGASTRALLGDHVEFQDMGPHALKGFSDPVLAWRVLSVRDTDSRFESRQTGKSIPLVGRQAEMELLLRAWDGSSQGRGQVVLIQGEAGIGKSRLLEALRDATGKDRMWISMRSSQFHSASAFYPIIEHLKRVMDWQPEDSAAGRFAKLEKTLSGFKAVPLAESVPLIANLMSVPWSEDRYPAAQVSAQQRREATMDVLAAWMLEVAEHGPVLMVWEDLHWADPTTLEALGNVIEQAPTVPMLVIATYRPELSPPWPNRSYMTPITLNRLERPEVEAIVGHAVDRKALPREVLDHIVAKSDGVPLYVEELTKTIIGSGVLEDRGDAYVLNGALSRLNIPETLQDSLMARLDRVPRLREVAQLGSVLGREFAYDMISALMGIEEPQLQSGLGQLVVDELLYQRGRPPRSRYLFKHALIQDAAYQSLLKRTRQQYHQQVAKLLEERFPDVVSSQPELLAHHYAEANCPAEAIGYWLRAGEASAKQSANVEAIDQFRKGLELVAALSDPRERDRQELDLLMGLGPALAAAKRNSHPEFGQACTRAWEICEQLGDDIKGFAALRGLMLYHLATEELVKSQFFAEQALRAAERLEDASRLVGGHMALGSVLYSQGKLEQAPLHFQLALEKFDPREFNLPDWSGSHPAIQCQSYLATISWMLGYPGRSLEEAAAAVKSADALGHPLLTSRYLKL